MIHLQGVDTGTHAMISRQVIRVLGICTLVTLSINAMQFLSVNKSFIHSFIQQTFVLRSVY